MLAPKSKADLAVTMHMLHWLATDGTAVIVEFTGDIYRGGAEAKIRKYLIDNNYVDADVLLDMNEIDGWEAEEYVEQLYRVFRSKGTYKDKVSRRSRCVTVNYVGEFHMEVVPLLTRHGERFITNRRTNQFERTEPERCNEWLDSQNRITIGRLAKVIRLLKYIRDFKNNFSVKSVILTILVGE